MGKIIVIGSQKGGVGKTTTTLNLAYSLREMGKKVLTVDFDSQANLTTCYGIEDTGALEYTIGHLVSFDGNLPWRVCQKFWNIFQAIQSLRIQWQNQALYSVSY